MANNPYKYDDPSGHKLKDFLQVGKNIAKPSLPEYALNLANTARNTILDIEIEKTKNTKVTNQQEAAQKVSKLLKMTMHRATPVFKPQPCPKKSWWEQAFIDIGNGIQDFGNGVKKGIETVVESTVDSVISFTEFVQDFVNDPIGTTANVLSAMWDTIKDPKFWVQTGTAVLVGLGITTGVSIPVGILVTCIATSAVGEAYDLCFVHRFNLDSFFASRGCKTLMEYIGKQTIMMGAEGLKGYLSGKVIERFTTGKGSSTNKLPDNDLIEDSVQDAIEDGVSDETIKGASGFKLETPKYNTSKLQHEFKHSSDFGINGSWNKASGEAFKNALVNHVNTSDTILKSTFRGDDVIVYFNKTTGLGTYFDLSGNFVSGWKLNPNQLHFHFIYGVRLK